METDQEVLAANRSSAVQSVNHRTTTNGLLCSWAEAPPSELCSQRVKKKFISVKSFGSLTEQKGAYYFLSPNTV